MQTQLWPDLRTEPVLTRVRTGVQSGALPSNVCAKLWPLLQPLCTQRTVLAVLWWLRAAQGVWPERGRH
ncbi:MAG: hypothetical protein ACRDRW_17905 [Pseudonocardiaceae bacterium]